MITASRQLYGCIDVGTNSIKVVIADLADGKAEPVFEMSIGSRLGEGMSGQQDQRQLQPIPMERTMDGLEELCRAASEYHVESLSCVGTSALREASNGPMFVEEALRRLNLKVEIISGQEEARLSFLAVSRDPVWRHHGNICVIDVGGGSTEVISGVAASNSINSRTSVRIGAVRLTEQYLNSDPPSPAAVCLATEAARIEFLNAMAQPPDGEDLLVVGVGGTFSTLAAMTIGGIKDSARIHGYNLCADDLRSWINRLGNMTVTDRAALAGLDPKRADIILGGAIVVDSALSFAGSDRVGICTRGLRWGVLYDRYCS